jgi:pentatricopeptide repeat protein
MFNARRATACTGCAIRAFAASIASRPPQPLRQPLPAHPAPLQRASVAAGGAVPAPAPASELRDVWGGVPTRATRGRVTLHAACPLATARALRRAGRPAAAVAALRAADADPDPDTAARAPAHLAELLRALRDVGAPPHALLVVAAEHPASLSREAAHVVLGAALNVVEGKRQRALHSLDERTDPAPGHLQRNKLEPHLRDGLYSSKTQSGSAAGTMLLGGRTNDSTADPRVAAVRVVRLLWKAMMNEKISAVVTEAFPLGLNEKVPRPDSRTVALVLRVCKVNRDLPFAREVVQTYLGRRYGPLGVDAAAAYITCLGACARSAEAEIFVRTSAHCAQFRTRAIILASLFRAFLASDRIADAEALIVEQQRSRKAAGLPDDNALAFLDTKLCNAFVDRCSALRLSSSAVAFVDRMQADDAWPRPDAQTYNLLIKALCAPAGNEDASIAADRALVVVNHMIAADIAPTTFTYNTLIRNLADQGRLDQALDLYFTMSTPDHLTFSHLMHGAAKAGNIRVAHKLEGDMREALPDVYPNYNYCKNLLEVTAQCIGVEQAFEVAKDMAVVYAEALRSFRDVGGREAVRMALIHACGVTGDLNRAFQALRLDLPGPADEPVGDLAPLYLATALMQVCLDCHSLGQALEVFYSIKRAGLVPNAEVYEKLVYGLVSVKAGGGSAGIPVPPENRLGAILQEDCYIDDHIQINGSHAENVSHLDEMKGREDGIVRRTATDNTTSMQGTTCSNDETRNHRAKLELHHVSGSAREVYDKGHDEHELDRERRQSSGVDLALALLSEMHENGTARTSRHAAYVYNTLIAAVAGHGDLDVAAQLFMKLCRHNNPRVVYLVNCRTMKCSGMFKSAFAGEIETRFRQGQSHSELTESLIRFRDISNLGVLSTGLRFPAATTGTYNSMINAARVCRRPDLAFEVYIAMEGDRINEPGLATLSLLTDIALEYGDIVPVSTLQLLLLKLDDIAILTPDLKRKRGGLRKLIVSLRWAERANSS